MNAQFKSKTMEVKNLFSSGIWTRDADDTPKMMVLLKKLVRWLYLVVHGFLRDQCIIRAAALTFTTILSIVPFLAVAFSISKGFGLQNSDFIRNMLLRVTTGNVEVVDTIVRYIDNTNVNTLGWVGVATLLFTVFSLIGTIEKAFNTIWDVQKGRSPWRKIADFFPVILICPMFLIVASSFNVSIQKQEVLQGLLSISAIGQVEALLIKLAPLLFIWIAFTFMYAFVPYTKVNATSAIVGGVLGGSLWQLAQWAYITWQIGAANYNAIYGSFAQLPLLLMWLYISWVVVLLGAEGSFAAQNINKFAKQRFFGKASTYERQKLAILCLSYVARRFSLGEKLPCVEELSDLTMAPSSLISDIFETMRRAGVVVPVQSEVPDTFAPARKLDDIRVSDVLMVVNSDGSGKTGDDLSRRYVFLESIFTGLREAVGQAESNLTLEECAAMLPDDCELLAKDDDDVEECVESK